MTETLSALALLNLGLLNVMVGAAMAATYYRIRRPHLILGAAALLMEFLRHASGVGIGPGVPDPILDSPFLSMSGFTDVSGSMLLCIAVCTIAMGRIAVAPVVVILLVYLTVFVFHDFDTASVQSWYVAFIPATLAHAYLVFLAVLLVIEKKPARFMLLTISIYMLATRLLLPQYATGGEGTMYALIYFMDSIGFSVACGILMIVALETLHADFVASKTLQESSEADLQFVLDHAEDAFISFDENLVVRSWNQRAYEMLGFKAEEVIGKLTAPELSDEEGKQMIAGFLESLNEGMLEDDAVSFRAEVLLPRKSGERIPAEIAVRGVITEAGPLITMILRDLAAQKEFEEEKRVFEERVQHAQKLESLGVLAGGIAHDFNNLLAGIMGNADLAAEETKEKNTRGYLENIVDISARAADLTSQMLAYSGGGRYRPRLLNLPDVIRSSEHLISAVVSKKAAVSCDFPAEECPLVADETQLVQVLMNLVTNAADALYDSKGFIRISCGTDELTEAQIQSMHFGSEREAGRYVYLRVKDSGAGMDEDTLARLFDPFFSTKFTGRGLGMATVSAIIRRHEAAVDIVTAEAEGTTITVYFQLAEHDEWTEENIPSADVIRKRKGTVLVIEDEPGLRKLYENILGKLGFDVYVAEDGASGLLMFNQYQHLLDLVVLDCTLPQTSGPELYRQMRTVRSDIKAVFCSGYDLSTGEHDIDADWPAEFLKKPFGARELQTAVHDVLELESDLAS